MKKLLLILLIISFQVSAVSIRTGLHEDFYRVVIESNSSNNLEKVPFFDKNFIVIKIKDKNLNLTSIDKRFVKNFEIINNKNCKKLIFEKSKFVKKYTLKKLKNKIVIDFYIRNKKVKPKLVKVRTIKKYTRNKFYDPIAQIILSSEDKLFKEGQLDKNIKVISLSTDPLYSLINKELSKEETLKVVRPVVVVIDPGHGGKDPGAIANGLVEKNVNLEIARKLKKLLEESKIFKVYLTRKGDYYIDLYKRTVFAIKKKADIFISIHCNADKSGLGRGTYLYTLNLRGAKSKLARLVEKRENNIVMKVVRVSKNKYVNKIVAELAMNTTMTEGRNFAFILKEKLKNVTHVEDIDSANFAVLKTPGIPSVLIETAYLTNKHDAKLLRNKKFIDNFATAIYRALESYFFNYKNLVLNK